MILERASEEVLKVLLDVHPEASKEKTMHGFCYHVAIRNKAEDPIIRMQIEAFSESLDDPMSEESFFELLK